MSSADSQPPADSQPAVEHQPPTDPTASRAGGGRRAKPVLLLALVAADLAVLLGWSQNWFSLRIRPGAIGTASVSLDGQTAAGAAAPLALSGLALVLALLLAGPVFRVVLGVLQALLGLCVLAQAWIALADPAGSATTTLVQLSGNADQHAARAIVVGVTNTPWPAFTLAVGVVLVLLGLGVTATGAGWPNPTSRYSRTRAVQQGPAAHEAPAAKDTIAEWDALSAGDDPTDR